MTTSDHTEPTRVRILAADSWRFGLIALIAFLTLVDLFATQAILPSLVIKFGVSRATMGFAVNASTFGMAVAGIAVALFGRGIDRRNGIWISGNPDRFGVWTSSASRWSSTRRLSRYRCVRSASPRAALTSRPASTVASEAVGTGPEYRYGGAAIFRCSFTGVGHATKASRDEYALEKPPTSTMLS